MDDPTAPRPPAPTGRRAATCRSSDSPRWRWRRSSSAAPLGAVLRYLPRPTTPFGTGGFPWPTLLINLTGSLTIGLLLPVTQHFAPPSPMLRPLFVIGFLGGGRPIPPWPSRPRC